jgi:hypothetical protein
MSLFAFAHMVAALRCPLPHKIGYEASCLSIHFSLFAQPLVYSDKAMGNLVMNSDPVDALKLPARFLRYTELQPGDVLLTRGSGFDSKTIAKLSGGEFSHAAIVVNQALTYESDGDIIGHRRLWRGTGVVAGKQEVLLHLKTNPNQLAVFRHPHLQSLPTGSFAAALAIEFKHSFGLDYSPLYRLVALADMPDKLKPILATALKFYEQKTLPQQVSGPFCSELVSRVYESMGLALFNVAKPSQEISPNQLSESNLELRNEIVVSSDSVIDYRPSEQPRDDSALNTLAHWRRGTRLMELSADNLTDFVSSQQNKLQIDLMELQNAVDNSIRIALQLYSNVQANGSQGLKEWTQRLCEGFLEFTALLSAARTQSRELGRVPKYMLELNQVSILLSLALTRCSGIFGSQTLKRAITISKGSTERVRLSSARKKLLKNHRQLLQQAPPI